MKNSNKYSTLALFFLAVGIISVAPLVYKNNFQISADVNEPITTISSSIPLKIGINELTNKGFSITPKSYIVDINGSLLTVEQAQTRGIIDKVILGKDGTILNEANKVKPFEKFTIIVKDISLSPRIYLEGV